MRRKRYRKDKRKRQKIWEDWEIQLSKQIDSIIYQDKELNQVINNIKNIINSEIQRRIRDAAAGV